MDKKKILKIVFIVLFLSFIIAYVIEKSGYYEYNLRNKTDESQSDISLEAS